MSQKHPHIGMAHLSGLFGVSRQAWYKPVVRQEQVDYEEGVKRWDGTTEFGLISGNGTNFSFTKNIVPYMFAK